MTAQQSPWEMQASQFWETLEAQQVGWGTWDGLVGGQRVGNLGWEGGNPEWEGGRPLSGQGNAG